jgi:hypothetical protein
MSYWQHTINGRLVAIEWEIIDIIDYHDSEYNNVALIGEDKNGNKYSADGDTLSGELCDVYNIELI